MNGILKITNFFALFFIITISTFSEETDTTITTKSTSSTTTITIDNTISSATTEKEKYVNAVWYNIYQLNLENIAESKAQIDTQFRAFNEMKINTILFLVKNPNGRVYYKSSIVKPVIVNTFIANKNIELEWDPFDYIIKKSRKYGMDIYAYISVFNESGYFLEENPDFAELKKDGTLTKWTSPANPVVRQRVVDIINEIVKKYDIDGIQLDRMRYEDYYTGFNSKSVEMYKEKYQKDPNERDKDFIAFKKQLVSSLMQDIYINVKTNNPKIKVSAAVFHSPTTAADVLQDWVSWIKGGYIDSVYTMSYTNDPKKFKKYVDENVNACKDYRNTVKLVTGIGAYFDKMSTTVLEEEIKIASESEVNQGVCYFSAYSVLNDDFYELLKKVNIER